MQLASIGNAVQISKFAAFIQEFFLFAAHRVST